MWARHRGGLAAWLRDEEFPLTQQPPMSQQPPQGPPQQGAPYPRPPRKSSSTVIWVVAGTAALLVVALVAAGLLAVSLIRRGDDPVAATPRPTQDAGATIQAPTTEPSPQASPEPSAEPSPQAEESSDGTELPAEITFAAGASLPANLQPGFSTTLVNDPGWTSELGSEGAHTFTHTATGCELFTYQTIATDIEFGTDDYENSLLTLRSFYAREDIGEPGTYLYNAGFETSTVEFAAILVQLESGKGQLATARGFGPSNVALITTFTCADHGTTATNFETLAIPTIGVEFVPQ